MDRQKWFSLLIIALLIFLLFRFHAVLIQHPNVLSGLILLTTFVLFAIRFERKKLEGREIVLLAVLSAIASVSRIPFAMLPSVQPTTFIVIITGYVFGAESGFLVGATAALVSNLFLGQGPWTPWQMLAWGLIGLFSGWLKNVPWFRSRISLSLFGLLSGYFFGALMNMWLILNMVHTLNWKQILALYSASFIFDTIHGLSNVFFLFFFSRSWIKVLTRFKKKYGLL